MYQSKQVGWKDAPTPSQNVTCGSESDRFDIGVVCSSGEILVLLVRDVKMGLGVMVYPFEWFW